MLYTEIHGDTLKKVLRKAYTTGKIRLYVLKNVFNLEELLKYVPAFFTSIFTGAAAVLDGKTTEYYHFSNSGRKLTYIIHISG